LGLPNCGINRKVIPTSLLVFLAMGLLLVSATRAQTVPVQAAVENRPVTDSEPRHVPGSAKTYTQAQINDSFNPPDWFPNEHVPMPEVVHHGKAPKAFACVLCHLTSGLGHPESANLAGLPAGYLNRQISEFKSGARKGTWMVEISKAISEEDARQATEWFASLTPSVFVRVLESETVPKHTAGRMHMPLVEGGSEPLGMRIVEMPEDVRRALSRDPHSGFVAYVPVGSIAQGEKLVKTGGAGKTIPCSICHGDALTGLGEVPRIAGLHPEYLVRQLSSYQTGATSGDWSPLMKKVVSNLDESELIAISAYLGSIKP